MPETDVTIEERLELTNEVRHAVTIGSGVHTRDLEQADENGSRIYWALAYAEGVEDRHGTIIDHGAFSHVTVDDFRILAHHDQASDPVGKPVALEYTADGLMVGFVFPATTRGQEMETLVAGGFMRAVSVGFIPLDGFKRKADGVPVLTKCDLLELSLVNAPSSKAALVDLSRALSADPDELAALYADVLRADPATELEQRLASFQARATDSAEVVETLGQVLQLASIADTAVDLIQDILSDLLGVVNPDEAQDEALEATDMGGAPEASESPAVSDVASPLGYSVPEAEIAATVEGTEKASARSVLRRTRRR